MSIQHRRIFRQPKIRTPALDAWRAELVARQRTRFTFDALWRAACEEMNALEAPTPSLAAPYLWDARRIIRAARRAA